MDRKYRVEVWNEADREWYDMWGYDTREEAREWIVTMENDDNYLSRTLGWDFRREYRIREAD